MKTMETQTQMILNALSTGERLTPMDAIKRIGCTKLSTRISELRRDGFKIQSEMIAVKNRFGKVVHVKQYWMR
jgi:hypothetical protein